MKIFVTGGCGFIGTNYIINLLSRSNIKILNYDLLTYSGNLENLNNFADNSNYEFIKGDICDQISLKNSIFDFEPDYIINFAAESHVDNSINEPMSFINTNIIGTYQLLEQARNYYDKINLSKKKIFKLHHVSTDEVYGDMEDELFDENSRYLPSSPYSASKASSDHLVRAWHRTYGLPIIITNCSNNYGPYQYPEKLIPVIIINAINEKKIPIYGNGKQIRDWIFVLDHCEALYKCMEFGENGETYNIGSSNQITNIELANIICEYLDKTIPRKNNMSYLDLIEYVKDRPGHDKKYGVNNSKALNDLSWSPQKNFKTGIIETVEWYLKNRNWWENILKKHD